MEKETNQALPVEEKQPKLKALNPMVLLLIVIALCAVMTYIIPAGSFDRYMDPTTERELIKPGSFHYVDRSPTTLFQLLMSLTLGLQNAAYIIFFLLIIGGMFAIINGTGAMDSAISNIVRKMAGRELFLIPVIMLVFGSMSAFCGNFEEFLAFIPLVLAASITMGFDSLTAVGIVFCAAAAGYGGAMTNAFTVGIAQGIAGLPMFSGIGLRAVLFVVLEIVSIAYVLWYARRVKKDPTKSGAYEYDKLYNHDKKLDVSNIKPLTTRQKLVLAVFILGLAFTIWGIIVKEYYIDELAAIFLAIGILAGIIGGMRPSEICDKFVEGCHDMLFPGIMIGLANAAVLILQDGNIMDTIIYGMSNGLNKLPSSLLAIGMFIFQDILNVLVPSGSGQAAITMPLMAPLADMLGVSRQTSVLAYQLGDAFTNVMTPTGGEILAALAMCKVPFSKWAKYLFPLFCIWWVVAFVFLIIATQIGYGPF
ncbi:MAG: YfcC family protein [Bacteroidales bacterium]|nr:YfcC family protein [Clostridia bacterium]MBR1699248.1 YfcC family protein [Bacteroidales bacterium]